MVNRFAYNKKSPFAGLVWVLQSEVETVKKGFEM